MSLFTPNFEKEGKGVTKEETEKRSYFGILARHFWKLIQLNLIYIACTAVFFGLCIYFAKGYDWNSVLTMLQEKQRFLLPVLPFIPLIFIGPFTAGLTYNTRNYAREAPVFMWSDFWDAVKNNLLQSLLMSTISTIVMYLYFSAVLFYISFGIDVYIVLACALCFGIILLSMSFYTYPMIVTVKLSLWQIIKNSFTLSIAKLPQNLFIILILGVVHYLIGIYLYPVWLGLMATFLIAWTSYTINYYVWNVLSKYVITKTESEEMTNGKNNSL